MNRFLGIFMSLLIIATIVLTPSYSYAKKGKGVWKSTVTQPSASERIKNESVDAIADVLTGEGPSTNISTKNKATPPGLAKKGKIPPGHAKGKKTGWNKEESGTKSESPIKQLVKGIFKN